MKKPTVSNLADENWLGVETIIDDSVVRELIPQLKQAGASGIIEYPLNKCIPNGPLEMGFGSVVTQVPWPVVRDRRSE